MSELWGLQWRQADVSISIRLCGLNGDLFGGGGSSGCVLLYLAKKLRSIVGHIECVEGSIVRQESCEGHWGDQW